MVMWLFQPLPHVPIPSNPKCMLAAGLAQNHWKKSCSVNRGWKVPFALALKVDYLAKGRFNTIWMSWVITLVVVWLYHVYWELWTAAWTGLKKPFNAMISICRQPPFWRNRNFKGVCILWWKPTGWPRRLWWWLMVWQVISVQTWTNANIGLSKDGQAVYLKDIWPSQAEIDQALQSVNTAMFQRICRGVWWWCSMAGDSDSSKSDLMFGKRIQPIFAIRHFLKIGRTTETDYQYWTGTLFLLWRNSVTADHISPAGNIEKTAIGCCLQQQGFVKTSTLTGLDVLNHEVMMRGALLLIPH